MRRERVRKALEVSPPDGGSPTSGGRVAEGKAGKHLSSAPGGVALKRSAMHDPILSAPSSPILARRKLLEGGAALVAAPWLALAAGCAAPGSRQGAAPDGATFGRDGSAATAGAPTRVATLAPADLALVNRVSWGASATTAADFSQRGRADWLG